MIRGSDLRLANVNERLRRLGLFNLKAKTHEDWGLGFPACAGDRSHVTPRMCRFIFILQQSQQAAAR